MEHTGVLEGVRQERVVRSHARDADIRSGRTGGGEDGVSDGNEVEGGLHVCGFG